MIKIVHTAPVGKVTTSAEEFRSRLDSLAIAAMPVKGDESLERGSRLVRYFRLEVEDFLETPWVTIIEREDDIIATVCDNESLILETPEEAFEALRDECRSRLTDAGITPAF